MHKTWMFGVMVAAGLAGMDARGQKLSATELVALSRTGGDGLRNGIAATFDEGALRDGTAWVGSGPEMFFAVETTAVPVLVIDEGAARAMTQVAGTATWYGVARVEPVGRLHAFYYRLTGPNSPKTIERAPLPPIAGGPSGMGQMQGDRFGGRLDLPVFGPLSALQPGVPSGVLSEKKVHTSRIYDGLKSEYWVYVPAQYDPKRPAPVMVFQDGGGYLDRKGGNPALNVIDNLVAEGKIPAMICVFINPGDIAGSPGTGTFEFADRYAKEWKRPLKDAMRSTEYDTVSDRYAHFVVDEVLAEVAAQYPLRSDAYSRAIMGSSSGGIAAFNAAWQMPDQFSRVISWIGSFTSIQFRERPDVVDGGQDYPDKVMHEAKRNLRVWLQDGANDMENERYGSWPLANIRMANALKEKGYDFRLRFGQGTHNGGQGAVEFPEEMAWLWRGYDAAKTSEVFVQDEAEKAKPVFRVKALNRED